jgi:hypothetical protein
MLHNFKRIATASGFYHEIRWNLEFSNVFDEFLPPDNVRGWVCIGAVISPHAIEQLLSEHALRFTPCPTVNRNQLFQGCLFELLLHAHCLLMVVLRKTPRPRGMLNEGPTPGVRRGWKPSPALRCSAKTRPSRLGTPPDQTGSVRPQTTASTVAPCCVVTLCTQPFGR